MKLSINWREIGIQILKAIWPVIAGALTGATVVIATGCTSMATQPRGQTTEIIAYGIPAIAWISNSSQMAENYGGDTNAPTNAIKQVVPVTTVIGK
ncbi:MAG: hypothetical protein MJ240_10595 [Kiritimatiellae bacterium]|nr:hypothetical protein [Kiritimatiellia bacterium]